MALAHQKDKIKAFVPDVGFTILLLFCFKALKSLKAWKLRLMMQPQPWAWPCGPLLHITYCTPPSYNAYSSGSASSSLAKSSRKIQTPSRLCFGRIAMATVIGWSNLFPSDLVPWLDYSIHYCLLQLALPGPRTFGRSMALSYRLQTKIQERNLRKISRIQFAHWLLYRNP